MKDTIIKLYGKAAITARIPASIEEYDSIATVKALVRVNAKLESDMRARILKNAQADIAHSSGIKVNEKESPSAYFDRLTQAKKGESPLVSADVIAKVITDEGNKLEASDVLIAERSSGGTIPSCSEASRSRLQAVIDAGNFDRNKAVLATMIANAKATAEAFGLEFDISAKAETILEAGDYTDKQYLDAYVYAVSFTTTWMKAATDTSIVRTKKTEESD
jgi:hypothetical protein